MFIIQIFRVQMSNDEICSYSFRFVIKQNYVCWYLNKNRLISNEEQFWKENSMAFDIDDELPDRESGKRSIDRWKSKYSIVI